VKNTKTNKFKCLKQENLRCFEYALESILNPADKNSERPSNYKGGLTPRQQLATCCLQHFLVMTGNITKKCCGQHVANGCLGVRPP
jgi:hypothetical protein